MSERIELARKFIEISTGYASVDGLDDLLHPEFMAEKYFTPADKVWISLVSSLINISVLPV